MLINGQIDQGSGFLFILDLSPSNHLTLAVESRWTDGLFDLAFAEDHPDIILTASGDGGIQLWDLKTPEVILCDVYCTEKII